MQLSRPIDAASLSVRIQKGYRTPFEVEQVAHDLYDFSRCGHESADCQDLIAAFRASVETSQYQNICEITAHYLSRLANSPGLEYEEVFKAVDLCRSLTYFLVFGVPYNDTDMDQAEDDMGKLFASYPQVTGMRTKGGSSPLEILKTEWCPQWKKAREKKESQREAAGFHIDAGFYQTELGRRITPIIRMTSEMLIERRFDQLPVANREDFDADVVDALNETLDSYSSVTFLPWRPNGGKKEISILWEHDGDVLLEAPLFIEENDVAVENDPYMTFMFASDGKVTFEGFGD